MNLRYSALVGIIFLIYKMHLMESRLIEFTNIKCTSLDRKFSEFEYCYLKAANRTYKYLSLKVLLHKMPVPQFSLNAAINKRSNGLMPVSYNLTFDGCRMVADMGKPLISFLFGLIKAYSNINHSCPFDHDIIVDKLPTHFVNQQLTGFLPLPDGDYVFNSNWLANGINRANVRLHFSYT
ncbi:uncharacterized protein LOC108103054 [Drosophila eugracilis]|uniref:uncharacterized protein LOC108103054 n=1 Tax=Drosophila eugracilis TaxID=29029 RepID=UPI001BDAE2AC|nr:uncharacterized protein LOC108103054 [Drosophila eugracilis]